MVFERSVSEVSIFGEAGEHLRTAGGVGDGSVIHCIDEPGVPDFEPPSDHDGLHRGGHRMVRVSWDLSRIDTLGVFQGKESCYFSPSP